MHRLVTVLTMVILFLAPVLVGAQGETRLNSVSVDIWPEYDQPAVLVIYHITLVPEVTLPTTVTLQIPAKGQINAVAIVNPAKGQLNTPYERTVQGDWATLTITVNTAEVQVEYYEALAKSGTTRNIVFKWAGDYAVDVLETNFLQPLGAYEVNISPVPGKIGIGQDGMMNYHNQVTHLAANQPYSVTISYQRNTDDVSISNFPVQAALTPGADTPGSVSMVGVLSWVLGGIGVLLIVVGVIAFIVWQRGGRGAEVRKRPASPRKGHEAESIHCRECGKRAQPGDVFCRTCGTRLNRESAE